MKWKIKGFFLAMGMSAMIGCYIAMLYTFTMAFLSPSKMTVVSINTLGEANSELIWLLLTLPMASYFILTVRFNLFKRKTKAKEKWAF